ncbi:hypothetical protein N3K66_003304 [Trichothecium roseum]|uniref:Uncharacterized protein n=1 Tax=Trichothecium roseum TaxID=47278 RepID=A0ACC0V6U2_9HYPO|nr:hypothetical protein N3K66_003304 [Trichothecium roseum]
MAASNNMHNLTTLIKRLEAATSRLEDIATATETPGHPLTAAEPSRQPSASSSPVPTVPTPKPSIEQPLPEAIEDFDVFIDSAVDKYVKLSQEIGGVVSEQASEVLKGFQEQRMFLLLTTKAKKPSMSELGGLLKPTNDALMAVTEIKETNRGSPLSTHLSAVADGIMVLGWVGVDNRPYKHIDESLGSAQFFGNRVQKEYKEKDSKHIEWLQAFYSIFRDLSELVKQHYGNGIVWNANGKVAEEVIQSLSSSKPTAPPAPLPPAGGAPPPPPPPGPPPVLDIKSEKADPSSSSGFGAVFSELNKGESVTKGLRKVDKSEMTHKNPSLRAGPTIDGGSAARAKSPAPSTKPKPQNMRVKKPAKKELEGNKWTVENYEKEPSPVEIDVSLTQSVLISRCNNTTVLIKGKANQVTVENSNRLSLVVDTLVSTVDVVKANNLALQVMGTIPTVMLDQVDGASVYFSKESTTTKVYTSKSAGVNINILDDEDESTEVPLPSQICSYYDADKKELVNEIIGHAG